MKEQNKYDQMMFGFFDQLRQIEPFANRVAAEIVCEDTDLMEEIIQRLFKVMKKVAIFCCGYVKRGRFGG